MRFNKYTFVLLFLAFVSSCSNEHQKHIGIVEHSVLNSFDGVDVEFSCDEFEWVDTLTYLELVDTEMRPHADALHRLFDSTMMYVTDDFNIGYVFGPEYVTESRLRQLLNFENEVRKTDYLSFARGNKGASAWIDSFNYHSSVLEDYINNYSADRINDPKLFRTLAWIYNRIDHYNLPDKATPWSSLKDSADVLIDLERELSNPKNDRLIWKKALVKYHIKNPIFNMARQNVKSECYFDESDSLMLTNNM